MSSSRNLRSSLLLGTTLLLASCGENAEAEKGSYLVFVDTDLHGATLPLRMRIDLYASNGTWFDTRDVALDGKAGKLPVSFGVERGKELRVRVRVYPEGHTRPYEGERFVDWPSVLGDAPAPTDPKRAPRLVVSGLDRTPGTEPSPKTSIDRLVHLPATQASDVHVVLRTACAGIMANLKTGQTCVDTPRVRVNLPSGPDEKLSPPNTSDDCASSASSDAHVCVPGGAFVLGDASDELEYPSEAFLQIHGERLAYVKKFWIDRDEITVGRYRAALTRGFKPKVIAPYENDGVFVPQSSSPKSCTFSAGPKGRESYALNCASWVTLRAFCKFEGGDLPTEAQWEYVASAAGGTSKRRYAGAQTDASCSMAVVGRSSSTGCPNEPWASRLAVRGDDGAPMFEGDVTPLGVTGMTGYLSEFVLDNVAEYTDDCFASSPWNAVFCEGPVPDEASGTDDSLRRVARGGSWIAPPALSRTTTRLKAVLAAPFLGARCAYATQP